jgi:predicted AAA+ superfamily ATPase
MINRPHYLAQLRQFRDQPLIKVITGIRRSGKSSLLELYRNELLNNGVLETQIQSYNFEDLLFSSLLDPQALYTHITQRLIPNVKNYLFLDEIQNVPHFQKAVDSLYIQPHVDLYITGSNAYMLSGELATLLSGRYVEIMVLPLSFSEYLSFHPELTNPDRAFNTYVSGSAFPFAATLTNDSQALRAYLDGLYKSVVLKDVLQRHRIDQPMMLESVIRFVFEHIGSPLSPYKIANTMTSFGRKISTPTVESYLNALTNSFILYRAKRFDVKGKQVLKTNDKYYVADIGLRTYLLGQHPHDQGHILENLVYLELLRRGYDVFVGKAGDYEVDFVAQKGSEQHYFQVALTLRDPEVLNRELRSLKTINDSYPKTIITRDVDPLTNSDGIRIINLVDFLLETTLKA